MTNEQLEKANEIRSNIRTLKAECDSLAPDWKTGLFRERSIHKLLNGKPKSKTYKSYYCTEQLDIIGSAILITPDEVEILRNFKIEKIRLLQKELDEM